MDPDVPSDGHDGTDGSDTPEGQEVAYDDETPTRPPDLAIPSNPTGLKLGNTLLSKAAFGESQTDAYMLQHGWTRIDTPHESPYANGLDAIYKSPDGTQFAIVESKFDKSTLGMTIDGAQMSDTWLYGGNTGFDRIARAMADDPIAGSLVRRALEDGQVLKILSKISPDGIVSFVGLDSLGAQIVGVVTL